MDRCVEHPYLCGYIDCPHASKRYSAKQFKDWVYNLVFNCMGKMSIGKLFKGQNGRFDRNDPLEVIVGAFVLTDLCRVILDTTVNLSEYLAGSEAVKHVVYMAMCLWCGAEIYPNFAEHNNKECSFCFMKHCSTIEIHLDNIPLIPRL